MKMEIDLETMLDIALGGPEIGPLNLQVLHGIMREVFQRIDLSNQNIVVEQESSEFCNSFNFIKSKIDEKNKRPRTAGGSYQRFKSNVSVIVSDYIRVPIGEQFGDSKENLPLPSIDVEDRLRYIESELKNVKDFPSIDELRNWAKEKTSPDTVVTDLWHFVSLNHRVNGLEEGIQKLTTLVDKLLPELKALGEEQNLVNGKIDDLYSQFKGLSDRMTYIDGKSDSEIDNVNKIIEEQIQNVLDLTKRIEKNLNNHPKFKDLGNLITIDVFNEVQERAQVTVNDIREQLSSKLNYSILDEMVSQHDFQNFVDILNSVDTKLIHCAKVNDLEKFVTNDLYIEAQESARNMAKEMDIMNVTLSGKADISALDDLVIQADVDKLSNRINDLARIAEQQNTLSNELNVMQVQLRKKANNDDVIDVLKKEDMKKTLNKIQNHQYVINEIQSWQKTFDSEEKPLLHSKVNELMVQTSGISESLSNLRNEPKEEVDFSGLNNSIKQLHDKYSELDKTCQSNISGIINDIELKLDKSEIQPLKDYLENCYNTLALQYQESLNDVPQCNHQMHQPKPPKLSQGMPYISQSSINISRKTPEELGCNHPGCETYIPSKNDAAVIRTQMKFNCLSCSQPLSSTAHNQFQTVRGKPLNAYELDHLRLLQKMLKPDSVDINKDRACGGRHTSSIPYKKTGRTSAKSLPAMAFSTQDGILIDGEVDIEGLDGKLYRGLISKKDFISQNRCKSANAQLRTVSPKPGSAKERPISGKSADFRSYNYGRTTAT